MYLFVVEGEVRYSPIEQYLLLGNIVLHSAT